MTFEPDLLTSNYAIIEKVTSCTTIKERKAAEYGSAPIQQAGLNSKLRPKRMMHVGHSQ
jgi:hypothetical protein